MANEKSDIQNTAAAETVEASQTTAAEIAPAAFNTVQSGHELSELRELTRSLLVAVQEMRGQTARNTVFQDAIGDVKAAARAMLLTPAANAVVPGAPVVEQRGKCSPCECVSDDCCCFEIVLGKVRAAKPQIEPPDIGDIPVPPTINALEVQIYATVDGTGVLLPGLASTMDLRANGLPGGPGPWVTIERVFSRVCVKKNTTVTKQIDIEVREHDEGIERPIAFKDELGEASGSITLDCCMATIYPSTPIDVNLIHGGEGGGMVQIAFYARRVCC